MIQSRGFNILYLMNSTEVVYKIANKVKDLFNKVPLDEVIKAANFFSKIRENSKNLLGAGINLTKIEIKIIIKVITKRSYKNY